MAQTLGEAIRLLNRLGVFDITDMSMDNNSENTYKIAHRFQEEVIVPLLAIQNNCGFVLSKGDKYLLFADNITAKVFEWDSKSIVSLEEDIKRLYNLDAWYFLKKWYGVYPQMTSLDFLHIKVGKEGNKNE